MHQVLTTGTAVSAGHIGVTKTQTDTQIGRQTDTQTTLCQDVCSGSSPHIALALDMWFGHQLGLDLVM